MELLSAQRRVNQWMEEQGVRFSVIRQGTRQVSDRPFDPIQRTLAGQEFNRLEQGLIQRVMALNLFLNDVYHDKMILRDGVIPEEFVFSSPDFRHECMKLTPVKSIYAHIAATDLIRSQDGVWYAMEDSFSSPDGLTYTHFARQLLREADPGAYDVPGLCDNCGLDILLRQLYRDIARNTPALEDGLVVLLVDEDEDDDAFELRYLAKLTGAVAATADELTVMDSKLYYHAPEGGFQRVAILHRMTPDRCLDPLSYDGVHQGIPHLMEVYCMGNIAILNAPGCSLAEDRGLYCFVPDMIRYYLEEEPLLPNVPTYLPWYPDQREFFSNMEHLFFKDVASDRRTAAIRGSTLTAEQRETMKKAIEADPRRFMAQEILSAERLPVLVGESETADARCDLRLYTVHSDSIRVWMGGLSRFTLHGEGKADVGFKDTWVMAE